MRLIDADGLNEDLIHANIGRKSLEEFLKVLKNAPTIEAVPLDGAYIKQIRWERDIALQQLADIGCELGRDMTDIKEKIEARPVVHGEWIRGCNGEWVCSVCREENCYAYSDNLKRFTDLYCPHCGAKMN